MRHDEWAEDAHWMAARVAPAAWVFVDEVQAAVGDAEAALADGDWGTCLESAAEAYTAIVYCRLILTGHRSPCAGHEVAVWAALSDFPESRALRQLVTGFEADRGTAERSCADVRRAAEAFEAELPLRIPVIRTAQGFFPSIRVGADIEKLRERLGLAPIDWMEWRL
ncbi:hypothetical protein ACFWTE_16870 [Nocardiopsis sp. NPDC058631]|uniref:hypothetical protein n=1 Tax=Nocardiopsis sp. NPDC058631 TaxID=3346566 RepID=UPI00365715B6